MPKTASGELDALLDYLERERGVDARGFSGALQPGIDRRMEAVGTGSYDGYRSMLTDEPGELGRLVDTWNERRAFAARLELDRLRAVAVPHVLRARQHDRGRPVRIWCAGCGTGELTYALALMLAEGFGDANLRSRVQIFATDADARSLSVARAGHYPETVLPELPGSLRRFSERGVTGLEVVSSVRHAVVFGRHDLSSDAPIGNLDLLICRGQLPRMSLVDRMHLLARFHFALVQDGLLMLGPYEAARPHGAGFREETAPGVYRKQDDTPATAHLELLARAIPPRPRGPVTLPGLDTPPPPPSIPLRLVPRTEELELVDQELGTINEELQARMEELVLASDELECVNDELRVSNDELRTLNDQLQTRAVEAVQVSAALQGALGRMGVAVLVIDAKLRVCSLNAGAESVLDVQAAAAVGVPLDRLPGARGLEKVIAAVRRCIAGGPIAHARLDVALSKQRRLRYEVACSAVRGADGACQGALLIIGPAASERSPR